MMRPPNRAIDQRRVHPGGQIALGELCKGAGKRQFGYLRAPLPADNAAQRLIDGEAFDQRTGGGNPEHGLGDEGPGQSAGRYSSGRPAPSADQARTIQGHSRFENCDEPPEQLSHRLNFLAQPGKQKALDVAPAGFHVVERVGHLR